MTYFTAGVAAYLTYEAVINMLFFRALVEKDCAWLAERFGEGSQDRDIARLARSTIALVEGAGAAAAWSALIQQLQSGLSS
jgi:hypothetical protein